MEVSDLCVATPMELMLYYRRKPKFDLPDTYYLLAMVMLNFLDKVGLAGPALQDNIDKVRKYVECSGKIHLDYVIRYQGEGD